MLPIKLVNANDPKRSVMTWGVIDTGADECAVPHEFAPIIGHIWTAGEETTIRSGCGIQVGFIHMSTIKIYKPNERRPAFTIENAPIAFMPNLKVVLLGVKSFLSRFVLNIDYPRYSFSLKLPK